MHTDVPEFRGLNRKIVPQWLLVVMHHSGCFDDGGSDRDRHHLVLATSRAARSRTGPTAPTAPPVRASEPRQHRARARHRHGVPRRRPGRAGGERRMPADPAGLRARRRGRRAWVLRDADGARASPTTAGTSCGSRSRGRRTASPTRRSATPGATTPTTSTLDTVLDALVRRPVARASGVDATSRDARPRAPLIDEYVRFPVVT